MSQSQPGAVEVGQAEPKPMVMGFVLTLGHGVKHMFNAGFFIVLPELKSALGLSNSAVGTLSTFRGMGNGLGNFPAGYLADRYSDHWRAILGVSILAVGVFHFLLGSVSAFWLLVLMAALSSVAISFWHPPAITALSQKFAHRRGFALSVHGTGGSVGEALGPITAGVLLGFFIWRTVLQVSIIPAIAMTILIALTLRGLKGESGGAESFRSYLGSVRQVLRQPAMITILVVTGGFISAQAAVSTFLPIYLREDLGYSSLATSAFLSVSQVSGIISQPAMGFLSDRFGRKAVILPSILMLGITIFAIPFAWNGPSLLLVVVVMGAFNFPLMAIILAAALDVSGDDVPATTVSLVFGATVVFSSLTPGLAGVLADVTGDVATTFFMSAAISFATAGFAAVRSLSK
ncbi:MAG: MFS transporter [Chloroflexi bacterium]|nr:MFS transporter [Chloroflexota bacterium]